MLEVDLSFLTPDRAKKLLLCAPNGDELESIAPYDNDPDLLATCERFFYEVQHVPFFESRLRTIVMLHEVSNLVTETCDMMEGVADASTAVLASRGLRQFLSIVREAGNKLNQHIRGEALMPSASMCCRSFHTSRLLMASPTS